MKWFMNSSIILIIFTICLHVFAGFGGSRSSFSSGRSFNSSRSFSNSSFSRSTSSSYFGGSRASKSVTISRPSSSGSVSSYGSTHTTIVHETPSYSGDGFWHGMFWGHMLSQGNQPPMVIVANPAQQHIMQGAPAVVEQQADQRHGFLYYFTLILIMGAFLWLCFKAWEWMHANGI